MGNYNKTRIKRKSTVQNMDIRNATLIDAINA